jgi:16S rRNA (cytidine1402-2'-O)-methyltransferase
MADSASGRLYVVATPIGNLADLSPRARDTLAACGLIAAEDTRHTGNLLKHFSIGTPQLSLHDHNEALRTPEIIERLRGGISVALVSDAGTPAISDPGFDLVRAAATHGIEVIAIPGPCAAIAALSIAALPTDRFCFEGFLPARSAARRQRLRDLKKETRSMIMYESPHRIVETLDDCREVFGADRRAVVAREITKLHESLYRGTLGELCEQALSEPAFKRGEIAIVMAGAEQSGADEESLKLDHVLTALLVELPLKQAARLAAQITGARDNEAYKRALQLKDG